MAKAKKAKARGKSKAAIRSKAARKRSRKTARAVATPRRAAVKASKRSRRAAPKTANRAAKAPRKQRPVGEGDYEASRRFLKDQGEKRHEGEIPAMGQAAERAMEGPQGRDLRAAEEEARSHSKAMGG